MGVVSKQSIRNSINFYIGMVIGAVNTVLIYPNVFNDQPEHWGLIQILIAYAFVTSTFAQLGTPKTYVRFFPTIKNKGQLFFFGLILSSIGFFFTLLIYYLFKDQFLSYINASDLLVNNFFYVMILVFCISFFELFTSVSRSYLHAVTPIFLNEIFLKSYTLIILVLHGFKLIGFPQFLQLFVLGFLLKMLVLVFIQIKKSRISISFNLEQLHLKELFSFGFYVIIGGTSAILISKIDMMMINKYLDLKHVAYYAVAFYIGNAIKIPARSVISISVPLLAKAWENKDFNQLKLLYTKSAINLLLVGGLFFLVVWLNIDSILSILPEKFSYGKYVVLFIGLAQLFNISTGLNGSIIVNSKYYRWDLIFNIILLVITITTNILFIPIYGINGAAMATALSVLIFNILKMIFVYIKLDMHPFTIKTLYALLIFLMLYFIMQYIPSINNIFIDILLKSSVILILFIPVMYKLELSEDINKIINNLRNKISI